MAKEQDDEMRLAQYLQRDLSLIGRALNWLGDSARAFTGEKPTWMLAADRAAAESIDRLTGLDQRSNVEAGWNARTGTFQSNAAENDNDPAGGKQGESYAEYLAELDSGRDFVQAWRDHQERVGVMPDHPGAAAHGEHYRQDEILQKADVNDMTDHPPATWAHGEWYRQDENAQKSAERGDHENDELGR